MKLFGSMDDLNKLIAEHGKGPVIDALNALAAKHKTGILLCQKCGSIVPIMDSWLDDKGAYCEPHGRAEFLAILGGPTMQEG